MTIPLDQRIQQLRLAAPVEAPGQGIVASPFQFMVTGEDNLRVQAATRQGGVRLVIQGRMLSEENELTAFSYELPVPSTGFINQDDFPLGVGFIINMVVKYSVDAGLGGRTFTSVQLIRGFTGGTILIGTLMQGYLSIHNRLAWPGTPLDRSLDGPGEVKVILGTDPAPGVQISESVPSQTAWELIAWKAVLDTGPTAGNREPVLFIGGVSNNTGVGVVHSVIPASMPSTVYFIHGHELTVAGTALTVVGTLPADHLLLSGDVIRTSTVGFKAGEDDWRAPTMVVREWLQFREIL